ncbi:MAG: dephospho-CoA kinase [Flavobacteriaceae bacterium]
MKVVGLTGGIGSGKSTVAKMFKDLGVPVYIADKEAKELMHTPKVIQKINTLLGESSYVNGVLNRPYIASKVFSDKNLLEKLNAIVHPEVKKHFKEWMKKQKGVYAIKEAAILFENGGYKECDATILVTAQESMRVRRVMQRDQISDEDVEARMKNQWTDAEKVKLADLIIENSEGMEELRLRVEVIHSKLLKMFSK